MCIAYENNLHCLYSVNQLRSYKYKEPIHSLLFNIYEEFKQNLVFK